MHAIGIDLVYIDRFNNWDKKSKKSLQRVFCDIEIEYCLQNTEKSTQRFAARFAAKEALFKALTQYDENHKIPFLTFLSSCFVDKKKSGLPLIIINWKKLMPFFSKQININTEILLSISHDSNYTIAMILLSSC